MTGVAHVITGLGTGGAETMLLRLLPHLTNAGIRSVVVSLTSEGDSGPAIRASGVPAVALRLGEPANAMVAVRELATTLRAFHPDIVQTWMYHADLVGGLVGRLAMRCPVIWNLRTTTPALLEKRSGRGVARACAVLSSIIPERIVCCSHSAVTGHAAWGYDRARMVVIHNGFDIEAFRPDAGARLAIRSELGIGSDIPVVGVVGRFDPLKDHETFVTAAGILAQADPRVLFVLCGEGITWQNTPLREWIDRAGIAQRCRLLGRRQDVARINAALDVATCCSRMEGLPNVVGEAMACAVPCVVTDVGDSALIVGETGRVVAASNPMALAQSWSQLLASSPDELSQLGAAARQRIIDRFSMGQSARQYTSLYEEVRGSRGGGRSRPWRVATQ